MSYTQLAREERYQIYALRKARHTQSDIAQILGRHKSTISRELRRNRGLRGYRPKQAHRLALSRQHGKAATRFTQADWLKVTELLKQEWSPEQISGRLEREHGRGISPEWIYQYVYADKRRGGNLWRKLRCQKRRRKRYGHYDRRGVIPNQVSIDHRPALINMRSRLGDWEGDTVIGKGHKGALVTLVERKSLFTLLRSVEQKTSSAVSRAVTGMLAPLDTLVHTITYDNGREFADHEQMAKTLAADIYFAHPYSSWERGVNENTNGLIRQYFPKQRTLDTVTEDEEKLVMDRLNHRPRKTLGYRTPHEVFYKTKTSLTVALGS